MRLRKGLFAKKAILRNNAITLRVFYNLATGGGSEPSRWNTGGFFLAGGGATDFEVFTDRRNDVVEAVMDFDVVASETTDLGLDIAELTTGEDNFVGKVTFAIKKVIQFPGDDALGKFAIVDKFHPVV